MKFEPKIKFRFPENGIANEFKEIQDHKEEE
jgi:hypothetical protein